MQKFSSDIDFSLKVWKTKQEKEGEKKSTKNIFSVAKNRERPSSSK